MSLLTFFKTNDGNICNKGGPHSVSEEDLKVREARKFFETRCVTFMKTASSLYHN